MPRKIDIDLLKIYLENC